MGHEHGPPVAPAVRRRREEFARALYAAVVAVRPPDPPAAYPDLPEWCRAQLLAAVDLLERWLATGDPAVLDLFDGWVRSRMVAELFGGTVPADYRPDAVVRTAA